VPFGSSNPAIIKIIKRRKEETILINNGQSSHFLQQKLVERMMNVFATRTEIQGCCGDRYAI
jgi:hypothetical protein